MGRVWDVAAGFARPRERVVWAVATVVPVVLLYALASIVPAGFALYASLHDIPLLDPNWTFVGLRNYAIVVAMDGFWASLWRSTVYAVGSTVLHLGVGVWMALVLHRLRNRLLTAIVFTAYLVPIVVIALLALFLLDTWVGLLHTVGAEWLGLWPADRFVLGRPGPWPLPIVVLVGTWKYAPFVTIFTVAQLRSIPPKYYEAARVAGANRWQQFRDITLPRIRGVVLVVALLRLVFTFNKFDVIFLLTGGGPAEATTTLPLFAYGVTFGAGRYGLGNALAIVMFAVLALGAVAFFVAFRPTADPDMTL